jgi:septal ring factor EnvC (AmiA/AmiB activator)
MSELESKVSEAVTFGMEQERRRKESEDQERRLTHILTAANKRIAELEYQYNEQVRDKSRIATEYETELTATKAKLAELEEKNNRLRRILAHVPAKIAIQAKESAGYGERIIPMSYAEIRAETTNENDVREI